MDVSRILDNVMHDTLVGVSFGIKENRARFVGEGSEHEAVRILFVEMLHLGVYKPSFAAVGFTALFAISGTLHRLQFNAVCAHEIALVSVCPENFAAC